MGGARGGACSPGSSALGSRLCQEVRSAAASAPVWSCRGLQPAGCPPLEAMAPRLDMQVWACCENQVRSWRAPRLGEQRPGLAWVSVGLQIGFGDFRPDTPPAPLVGLTPPTICPALHAATTLPGAGGSPTPQQPHAWGRPACADGAGSGSWLETGPLPRAPA